MPDEQTLLARLAELLRSTGEAHHAAFLETDGADAEWPLWYAEHLMRAGLAEMLKAEFTRSELVYLLITAEREMAQRAPGAEWSSYYARFFAKRYLGGGEGS